MSFDEMNANHYLFAKEDYNNEFQRILSKIILCYYLMLVNKVKLVNDENTISDKLCSEYLNNDTIRNKIKLTDYLFVREVQENLGRVDIKIITRDTFLSTKAYYIIECKRIDGINQEGSSGLNGKYIEDGIKSGELLNNKDKEIGKLKKDIVQLKIKNIAGFTTVGVVGGGFVAILVTSIVKGWIQIK